MHHSVHASSDLDKFLTQESGNWQQSILQQSTSKDITSYSNPYANPDLKNLPPSSTYTPPPFPMDGAKDGCMPYCKYLNH